MLYFKNQLEALFKTVLFSYFSETPSSGGSIEVSNLTIEQKDIIQESKNYLELLLDNIKISQISKINTDIFKRNLKIGTTGEDVRILQEFLLISNPTRINRNDITIGKFDGATLVILQNYLRSHGYKGAVTMAGNTTFDFIKKDVEDAENRERLSNLVNSIDAGLSSQEVVSEFSEEEMIVANFDEKRDITNNNKVRELQVTLNKLGHELKGDNNGVDGLWGESTIIAFHEEEDKIKEKVRSLQVDSQEQTLESSDIFNKRHNNTEEVKNQVEATRKSVESLKNKLIATSSINENLSDYFFRENAGYSIEELLRKIFKKDKYNEIPEGLVDKVEYYQDLLKKGGKQKLENAIIFLTGYENYDDEGYEIEKSRLETIVDHAGKAMPWLLGIYLGDIPLSFLQKISGGANINKSVAFKNWMLDGMQGEFKDYYNQDSERVNVIENQYTLRGILTTLSIPDSEIKEFDKLGVDALTKETKELLKTYIEKRLIPDLEIFDKSSFGFFDWLFDKKEDQSDDLLDEIRRLVKSEPINFDLINEKTVELIHLFKTEGDVKDNILNPALNRNLYFKKVMDQNSVFENISYLYSIGGKAHLASILFYLDNVKDFNKLPITDSDKRGIQELYKAIERKDDNKVLELTSNLEEVLTTLFSKGNKEYLLSTIPKDNYEYINVGNSKHGGSLLNMDRNEAYTKATTTTPEKGSEISQLGFAYQTLVEKGQVYGITYQEYETAFFNREEININTLISDKNKNPIINTGRGDATDALSTFEELQKGRGDEIVFKLEPIFKEYTYYSNGKKITQRVEYNLYMRPDCGNPLIVPGNIEVISKENIPVPNHSGKSPNEFDPRTVVLVDKKLPIVIPWFLLNGAGGGSGNGDGGVSSETGADGITGLDNLGEVADGTGSTTIGTIGGGFSPTGG